MSSVEIKGKVLLTEIVIAFERAQSLRGGKRRRLRLGFSLAAGTSEQYAQKCGNFDEHGSQYNDQHDQRLILRPLLDMLQTTLINCRKKKTQ